MIATALLLVAVAIASVTDARTRKIFNWTTYPGLVAAVALNGVVSWIDGSQVSNSTAKLWGAIGFDECLKGLAICGGLMLVGFVLFGIGGGDVKLMAMVGAFLGMEQGLVILLWTFLFGGMLGALILIWRVGVVTVVKYVVYRIGAALGRLPAPELTEDQQRHFKSELFLAPCAGLAVVLLKLEWLPAI